MSGSTGTGGTLVLTIIQAQLTRDVETLGKQDPYIKLMYMGTRYKTKVHQNGGKTPVWNETFTLQLGSVSDELHFEVKDDDTIGATLIGQATIKASSLCINNGVRDWFTFEYKGRSVGRVLLETKFTPVGGAKAAGVPAHT